MGCSPERCTDHLDFQQVSDLVWLGEKPYDKATGAGGVGVEFAGTAVSSTGARGRLSSTDTAAKARIEQSSVLQWQDGYYRGYFLMSIGKDKIETQFFGKFGPGDLLLYNLIPRPHVRSGQKLMQKAILGSPSVATRNAWDLPLANFTVLAGANRLSRPVAGGSVESGSLRGGAVKHTNVTLNTETGAWEKVSIDQMYLSTS